MQNKFILTDGQKAINLLDSDDPTAWTFFSNAPASTQDMLYARVAAAFRAYNLKANTIGNMPFTLNKGNAEFDTSADWQNNVGFLPNPSELFRLNTLSYIATNTIYNLRTSDALGYRVKGLYHAVATTFTPVVNSATQQVDYIERRVGAQLERYKMEDKKLVRMWRLDHTTELLPSPNTEARAIMNAAGEIFYADVWIKHFYERGGVAPTVIAMKGAVSPDKKQQEEKTWRDWILGLGNRFRYNPTRVVNADTLDVQQFGASVTDLKNNETYQRAITNIAMGTGMPLSLLMANSANYATAKEEKATWYENDIIPFCNWMAYEYNRQVFEPLGLFLEFHPETLDPQQEDETQRAQAINTFMDFLAKCPTFDIFIGTCDTFGYELSDSLRVAAEAYYADKEARAAEIAAQMEQAGVVVGEDGEPVAVAENGKERQETAELNDEDEDEEKKPNPFAKKAWTPSLDQLRELQRWEELAFRKLKRAEPVTFEWRNDTLPATVYDMISIGLMDAEDEYGVKKAFDLTGLANVTTTPAPVYVEDPSIKILAESINRMAEAMLAGQGVNNGG